MGGKHEAGGVFRRRKLRAPCLYYSGYAEAVGFEPTGVLPPLVFKTSAFVRSAIPPNGFRDYIRDRTTLASNDFSGMLLCQLLLSSGNHRPSRCTPLALILGQKLLRGGTARFKQLYRPLLGEVKLRRTHPQGVGPFLCTYSPNCREILSDDF